MRTLNNMRRVHGQQFNFHPEGYILPGERDTFMRQVQSDLTMLKARTLGPISKKVLDRASLWISKPVASSCGKGIKVLTSSQALALGRNKKALLQRYLHAPYLIDDKKFDLRIYVVVTGVDPLRVYVHNEGLTRISTTPYSLNNTKNRFAHLTNYTINKKSDKFVAASVDEGDGNGDVDQEGYKWSLQALKKYLTAKEGATRANQCFEDIHDLITKTMLAAESEITPKLHSDANYRSSCYELFGCDVILDRNLMPTLLEVNVSPSLMGSSPLDKKIKGTLISDTFHLVGFYPYDPVISKQYETNGVFAFSSLGKLVPDAWRKNAHPSSIDWSKLPPLSQIWTPLLMIDDEMQRASSTHFKLLHPTKANAERYLSLYRIQRFTDHMLAKWMIDGRSTGLAGLYIPSQYLDEQTLHLRETKRKGMNQRSVRVPGSPSIQLGRDRSHGKLMLNGDQKQQQQLVGSSSTNSTPRTRVLRHIQSSNDSNSISNTNGGGVGYPVPPASTSAPGHESPQRLITIPDGGQTQNYISDISLTQRAKDFLTNTNYKSDIPNSDSSSSDHTVVINGDNGVAFKSVNTTILNLVTAKGTDQRPGVNDGHSTAVRPPRPGSGPLIRSDLTQSHTLTSLGSDGAAALSTSISSRVNQKREERNIRLGVAGLTMTPSTSINFSSSFVQQMRDNNSNISSGYREGIESYQGSNSVEEGWYSPR